MPACSALCTPAASWRLEITTDKSAFSSFALIASMTACRLLPRPEIRTAMRRLTGSDPMLIFVTGSDPVRRQRQHRHVGRAVQPVGHVYRAYAAADEDRGVVAAPNTSHDRELPRGHCADDRQHDLAAVSVTRKHQGTVEG